MSGLWSFRRKGKTEENRLTILQALPTFAAPPCEPPSDKEEIHSEATKEVATDVCEKDTTEEKECDSGMSLLHRVLAETERDSEAFNALRAVHTMAAGNASYSTPDCLSYCGGPSYAEAEHDKTLHEVMASIRKRVNETLELDEP